MNLNLEKIAVKKINYNCNQPTIIFLHESLGCIEQWKDFPKRLGELTNCNVLIYDRQGYGKSCEFSYDKRNIYYIELEADILNQLLAKWNIEKVILFGHSDGGSIALIYAAKYPQKTLGIITEGAHIFVEKITIDSINKMKKIFQTSDIKTKLEKYHGNKTDSMFWAWASTWTSSEFQSWNIQSFLPNISCPALIIQGKSDKYGTLNQVEKTASGIGENAKKFIINNIGHSPHKECQELILENVGEFINNVLKR